MLTLCICGCWIWQFGPGSFTFAYEHGFGLITTAISFSIVHSLLLYAESFQEGKLLALGGNSGIFIYDVGQNHLLELSEACLIPSRYSFGWGDSLIRRWEPLKPKSLLNYALVSLVGRC